MLAVKAQEIIQTTRMIEYLFLRSNVVVNRQDQSLGLNGTKKSNSIEVLLLWKCLEGWQSQNTARSGLHLGGPQPFWT